MGPDGSLWLATHNGISHITGEIWGENRQVWNIGKEAGIPVHIVHDVVATEDTVWFATEKGISILPLKDQPEHSEAPPLLALSRVQVNGNQVRTGHEYQLPFQSSFSLAYAFIAFRDRQDIQYRYRITGLVPEWQVTRDEVLNFPSLPDGDFQLELMAERPGGRASFPIILNLTVATPWWKQIWFLIVMGLLVAGLVALIFREVLRSQKRNSERQQHIRDLKQQALISQMNPHFIFNALNTIHAFIVRKDSENAHIFLGKLARLIRNTLDSSQNREGNLRKELDNLKLYLELEKIRFQDLFEYEIKVDTQSDPGSIALPPMLLQPYVENAILHGVRHLKDRQGRVEVEIKESPHRLELTITDNGVGRTVSAEINAQRRGSKTSHGSRITSERIELIPGAQLDLVDLRDGEGQAAGTRVTIYMPLDT